MGLIFIENFENIAITTFRHPLKIWKRCVDDTFVIVSKYAALSFLVHISNINEAIQFTVERKNENGELPFLDCLIKTTRAAQWTQQRIGSLQTQVDA